MSGGEIWGSLMGEYVTEVDSSGDISGGELECAALREFGTEVGPSCEISGGNVDGKLEGSTLGE